MTRPALHLVAEEDAAADDPEQLLCELRKLTGSVLAGVDYIAVNGIGHPAMVSSLLTDIVLLGFRVKAMDEHLANGGALPSDWRGATQW